MKFIEKKKQKKRLSQGQRRRNLESYLSMAGYETSAELVKKRIRYLTLNLTFMIWLLPNVLAVINGQFTTLLYWTIASFVLLPFIWLILWGMTYFYLEIRMYNRTKELEDVLPDFLQLTSANISAGMPIDRALWLAIRPNFGVLAKEIEDVAKSTISGEDLKVALTKLTQKYDSALLKRSISILLEGLDAGGELADLLSKIALNIQELKIMKKEMAANVMTYAIFISFASVTVAPVLFALATQLIQIIIAITGNLDLSSSSLSITASVNPDLVDNFKIYSYVMMGITGGMSAAIISVIRNGNIVDGIRNIPIYMAIAIGVYIIANSFFSSIFSGFF